MNRILKQEYGLGSCFKTKALARKAIPEAIRIYNTRRPHSMLNNRMPAVILAQSMAS
jgi:transposase InsO family protein